MEYEHESNPGVSTTLGGTSMVTVVLDSLAFTDTQSPKIVHPIVACATQRMCLKAWSARMLLILFLLDSDSSIGQEDELALVVSSTFRMIVTPLGSGLLSGTSSFLQTAAASRFKLAQAQSDREYVPDKTKVVFQSAHAEHTDDISDISFFVLASEWIVAVPSGTAFRTVRAKAAEDRLSAVNGLAYTVLNEDDFLTTIQVTALFNNNSLASDTISEILSISSIAVTPAQPEVPVEGTIPKAPASRKLAIVDIVLIVICAVMLLVVVVFVKIQYNSGSAEASQNTDRTSSSNRVVDEVQHDASDAKVMKPRPDEGNSPMHESSYMSFLNSIIASSTVTSNNQGKDEVASTERVHVSDDIEASASSSSSDLQISNSSDSDRISISLASSSGVSQSDSSSILTGRSSSSDSTIGVLVSTVNKETKVLYSSNALNDSFGKEIESVSCSDTPCVQETDESTDELSLVEAVDELTNSFDNTFLHAKTIKQSELDTHGIFRKDGAKPLDDEAFFHLGSKSSESKQSETASVTEWMKTLLVVTSSGLSKTTSESSFISPIRSSVSSGGHTLSSDSSGKRTSESKSDTDKSDV